jgi:hypothetical protein
MARENNDQARDPERYSRDSFSMRRMKGWQLWSITVVAVAIIIAGIIYATA